VEEWPSSPTAGQFLIEPVKTLPITRVHRISVVELPLIVLKSYTPFDR
jgi:hypothetical protein